MSLKNEWDLKVNLSEQNPLLYFVSSRDDHDHDVSMYSQKEHTCDRCNLFVYIQKGILD